MHVPPPLQAGENAATGIDVGPVMLVFAGVVQSTWNFQSWSAFVPKLSRKFGRPAGGAVVPSTSDGNRLPNVLLRVTHCCVAAWPASIFVRSNAQTSGPRNDVPLALNMLKVV